MIVPALAAAVLMYSLAATATVRAASVRGEQAKPAVPSLGLVPDDVAAYSASLRLREQYDAVVNSQAWAKLKTIPVIQMGLGLYGMQASSPQSVPGKINAFLNDPDTRKLIDVGTDLASNEMFGYADHDFVDTVQLAQRVAGAMRYGPMMLQLSGKSDGDQGSMQARILIAALAKNLPLIKVPTVVLGFKTSNATAVKEQLDRLEKLAKERLEEVPKLKGRFQRTTVDGFEYLTLSLDGEMIPWEQIPAEEMDKLQDSKADAEKVIARVKQLKLTVAIGLRDDYLLVAIGPSTDALARLGKGKPLADRPELAPVRKFAQQRLISVGYLSKAMSARLGAGKEDIDELLQTAEALLPLAKLPAEETAQIRKDAAALAKDVKTLLPASGAMMEFSYLTAKGSEGYSYDWTQQPWIDGSKPLGLLQHVGGNPLLAAAARSKVSVANYDLIAKWVGVAYRYVEKYAVPKIPEDKRAEFDKFVKNVTPLVHRLDEANRQLLLPALADGQTAVVLDAKLKSKQFLAALPATEKPMPMLEPALVVGVSDAELLKKACVEYRAILDGLIDALRQVEDSKIPEDFKIPEAKVIESKLGTIYAYALPAAWGVDGKIAPNAGLAKSVAVVSLSQKHTERLLADAPLKVDGQALKMTRPLAGAVIFDVAGLVDAITPWVDFGVQKVVQKQAQDETADASAYISQAHIVLDVLKVVRNVVSESYLEGKVLVTHTRVEIRDVK
jgi:hypothetical protein